MTRLSIAPSRVAFLGLVLLFLTPPAAAEPPYHAKYWGTQDGHLKMWWTLKGKRISDNPFIDDDYPKGTNLDYSAPAPVEDINDHDQQFIKSGSEKTSETRALAGVAYDYDRFQDYLVDFGPSVTWLCLYDATDLASVSVQVDLVVWGGHLQTNPLPSVDTVFLFNALGHCPELPGYVATILDTGDPYSGELAVIGLNTLAVPEPATLALLALGGLGALGRLRSCA